MDKKLRRLAEAATQEAWRLDSRSGCVAVRTGKSNGLDSSYDDIIAFSNRGSNFDGHYWDMDEQTQKNFAFIAAANPATIIELLDLIEQQQAEIERLKCCGNCEYYRIVINEGRCFVELPQDEWRHSLKAKFASGDEKCDKWERLGDD